MKTVLSIKGDKFLINDKLTYSEIKNSNSSAHGLLMNARFVQGIFNDTLDPSRFNRFGMKWDADQNVEELILALPEWYRYGLRGITVGFQGGGPCFTIPNSEINTNPFSEDGLEIDPKALERMEKIIKAADEIGMVVIVSGFYSGQIRYLRDDEAVINVVKNIAKWLKNLKYRNIIFEIANEKDVEDYKVYPIIFTDDGMCQLIKIAQDILMGDVPVGCSTLGCNYSEKVAKASDVNIIHGNNMTRQRFYNKIMEAKKVGIPVLCNEDSQALGQLGVTFKTNISWGYYNNLSKQEPPVRWGIQKGEDLFFATRMAMGLGIEVPPIKEEDQFYLQGLEENMTYNGKRWIRLASLYPETIDYVSFYENDKLVYIAYDDPFLVYFEKTWQQAGVENKIGSCWKAVVHLTTGKEYTYEGYIR